ncbi:MAG TPA: hypothetical protein PK079_24135 [Leptospiraceae bacterium]|nr:hypothetical protein [Leptospiraceae bacterium]HNE56275.1 hypothetical protein [Leptospiraceae bacterium]
MSQEFTHPFEVMKASFSQREGKTDILIKASSEMRDRQGETILKSAYLDKAMQQEFLSDNYIDWNHLTDYYDALLPNAKPEQINQLMIEKEKAIIGRATQIGFKDDFPSELALEPDKLYARGYLINDNGYVQQMLPKLKAGFDAYAASVMGHVDKAHKSNGIISHVKLKKIALAPRMDVMNPDTSVTLVKGKTVHSLTKILKGFTDTKYPVNNMDMDSEVDNQILAQVQMLQKKVDLLYGHLTSQPDFYTNMVGDLTEQIESRVLPVTYEAIKQILMDKYCCSEMEAADMAQKYIVELNITNRENGENYNG